MDKFIIETYLVYFGKKTDKLLISNLPEGTTEEKAREIFKKNFDDLLNRTKSQQHRSLNYVCMTLIRHHLFEGIDHSSDVCCKSMEFLRTKKIEMRVK